MRYLLKFIVLILLLSNTAWAETFKILKVIDGDTIVLSNKEHVRLIGIDTPESRKNSKAKKDADRSEIDINVLTKMGKEATNFIKQLLPKDTKVELEFDVQKRDKYGRLLAYVFIPSNGSGKKSLVLRNEKKYLFINAVIVESGYAQPMTIPPNVKYAELFRTLNQEARTNKLGLWKE